MITKDQIAEIVRNTDAESEEHANDPSYQVEFWRKRGVDVNAVRHVAEQRAMRVVMRDKGLTADPKYRMPVGFTQAEIMEISKLAGMWFDAFAAGLAIGRRHPR